MEINGNWISDLQVSLKNGAGKKAFHILQAACLLRYRGRINYTSASRTVLKSERASPVCFWDHTTGVEERESGSQWMCSM